MSEASSLVAASKAERTPAGRGYQVEACRTCIVPDLPSGSCRILPNRSFPIIWSDAGLVLVCLHGVAAGLLLGILCPSTKVSSTARDVVGADRANFEDNVRDECPGNTSTIAPRGRTSFESLCLSSHRSETHSRRQATLTVSRRSPTHLTEAEPEELRDFAEVGFREEAAETVDEEGMWHSGERILSELAAS
jgi:hypothetical protein